MRVVVSKSLITAVAVVVLCLLSFGAHGASADLTLTFSNDSGANVTGLVVYLTGDAQAKVVHTAAPGCGTPDITYLPDSGMAAFIDFGGTTPTPVPTPVGGTFYDTVFVTWPTACLAPGAAVTLEFDAGCGCVPPSFSAHEWLPRPAVPGQTTVWPHNDTGRFVSLSE